MIFQMKRILSDGVNEPKLCKFIKEESPHKVKQEPYDDEDLVHLGSESIPSPTSSTSPPFPTEPAVQTIKLPKYMEVTIHFSYMCNMGRKCELFIETEKIIFSMITFGKLFKTKLAIFSYNFKLLFISDSSL